MSEKIATILPAVNEVIEQSSTLSVESLSAAIRSWIYKKKIVKLMTMMGRNALGPVRCVKHVKYPSALYCINKGVPGLIGCIYFRVMAKRLKTLDTISIVKD